MQEVIMTPGRYGSKWKKNSTVKELRRKPIEEDEVGGQLRMRPRGLKNFDNKYYDPGCHLAPLGRYFESKIGQRWDDIYSEVCHANRANTYLADLRERVSWFVETNVIYYNGRPCKPKHSWYDNNTGYLLPGQMYVDLAGRLAQVPKLSKKRKSSNKVLFE